VAFPFDNYKLRRSMVILKSDGTDDWSVYAVQPASGGHVPVLLCL